MWRERGADGIRRPNRGCHCRVIVLTYLVLTNVTGLFGFMMDMLPNARRCVTELLVERKEWMHVLPTEFVVRAMSLDKKKEMGKNIVSFNVKGKLLMIKRALYSDQLLLDDEQKTVDFNYNGYHEVTFCFINRATSKVRVQLDFKFVPREKTASSIRKGNLQLLEEVIKKVESAGLYIAAQLNDFSQSEHRLSKTSSMLWTCQLLCAVNTIIILLGLGIWQVLALRKFFKNKKLV